MRRLVPVLSAQLARGSPAGLFAIRFSLTRLLRLRWASSASSSGADSSTGYYPPPDLSRLATADLADIFIGDVDDLSAAEASSASASASRVQEGPRVRALLAEPRFCDFGGQKSFSGRVATVQCFENNLMVRAALTELGEGRVLVVDAGASSRAALVGDNLAELAIKNGWRGLLLNGFLRDAASLSAMPLGVKALGTHPVKSGILNWGVRDQPVTFGGVTFCPGDYLYADEDGVLVADEDLESLIAAQKATSFR